VLVVVAGPFAAVPGAQGAAATCRGLPVTIKGQSGTVVEGTPGDDVILAPYGTWAGVNAGAGDDVICIVPAPPDSGFSEAGFMAKGGDGDDIVDSTALPADHYSVQVHLNGDDLLTGSRKADVLIGGPGFDTAHGRFGRDLCRADVRGECELP
jgi:hypothetical protein